MSKQFYVTIEQVVYYNVTVAADNLEEAKLKARQLSPDLSDIDYTDGPEVTFVEEVKRHGE